MANRWGNSGSSERLYFLGLQNHWGQRLQPWNSKMLLGRKATTHLGGVLKSRDITLLTKVHIVVKSCGFSINHVRLWELDYKEGWAWKNWCFRTVVLEKTLESPLDCREIQPVNPKGNQPSVSTVRTDAETEAPVLWPPDAKNWLIGKDRDAGQDWGREEKEDRGWDV